MRTVLLATAIWVAASPCLAWHDPHTIITRAAILSLPAGLRQLLAPVAESISEVYSFYPDRYRNAAPLEQAFMRCFCELPDGRQIHNVTWDRPADIEMVEYLLQAVARSVGARDGSAMAQYAGTLAHLLEDSLSPAHAMDLRLLQDLVPPPAHARKLDVHAPMELSCPEFALNGRVPQRAGTTAAEAARLLVESCYARIRQGRGHVIELIRAVYDNDKAAMDQVRLLAAKSAAELYADALYTALLLAGAPRPRGFGDVEALPPQSSAGSGLEVAVSLPALDLKRQPDRAASLNLVFGLREAVRVLKIDQRVLRTRLGSVVVTAGDSSLAGARPAPPRVEILGSWPPYSGSQVTQILLDSSTKTVVLRTAIRGWPESGQQWDSPGGLVRTVDHRGDPLFEVRAGEAGSLFVRNHEGLTCSLKPSGAWFTEGVIVEVEGKQPLTVEVAEMGYAGDLEVAVSGRPPEVFPVRRQ